MRHKTALALILWTCCWTQVAAEPAAPRMITLNEAPIWNAVGRLNIAGNRQCSATLISATEVITAAHCLFQPVTHHRADPASIRFVAGFRGDSYAALVGVTATATLPRYVHAGQYADLTAISNDLALLRLDRPVLPSEAMPLTVQTWPDDASVVDILGYGRDRPLIVAIRSGCQTLDRAQGVRVLDCPIVPGLSGGAVVLAGSQTLVAVVSASVGTKVAGVQSMMVPIGAHLAELRALLGP